MTVVTPDDMSFTDLPGRRSADPLGASTSNSSVRVVELTRSEGRTAHQHPFSEEIVYVAAGRGQVWIEGVRHPVGPGDVVRIPAGAAHATIPAEASAMRLVCFFPHPDLAQNIIETTITVTEASP